MTDVQLDPSPDDRAAAVALLRAAAQGDVEGIRACAIAYFENATMLFSALAVLAVELGVTAYGSPQALDDHLLARLKELNS